MSWVLRILLDTAADNPRSLIAKFPPAVPWPKQKTVISALAKIHASGWQPQQFRNIPSHNSAQQIEGMESTYPIGWPVVIEQFGDLIPESVRGAGENIQQHISRLLANMYQDPLCLTHADMRLDNTFFKDGKSAVVD